MIILMCPSSYWDSSIIQNMHVTVDCESTFIATFAKVQPHVRILMFAEDIRFGEKVTAYDVEHNLNMLSFTCLHSKH